MDLIVASESHFPAFKFVGSAGSYLFVPWSRCASEACVCDVQEARTAPKPVHSHVGHQQSRRSYVPEIPVVDFLSGL